MTNNDYIQAESVKLHIGDLEFDAIRLIETGEYRMSQSQVLSAVGLPRNWLTRLRSVTPDIAQKLISKGFDHITVRVSYSKVGSNGRKISTRAESLALSQVRILWRFADKYYNSELAEKLVDALSDDSLRDRFDQAYDKPRISKEDRQLLDLMILAHPEKRGIHFGEEWRKEAERVTKYKWKTMPMAKFIRKAIYDWRFPAKVMVRVSEVNPYVDANRRQNKHYQHFEENIDTNVLQQHIQDVYGILKVSTSQSSFWNNMSSRFSEAIQQELI
jgi:hypothetical protein